MGMGQYASVDGVMQLLHLPVQTSFTSTTFTLQK
jgi:hypothetical protein